MGLELDDYQLDAVNRMKNGCLLCGSVGSGKSRTAIAYYFFKQGGKLLDKADGDNYIPMNNPPKDLYIITTARKRDTFEWEEELSPFLITPHTDTSIYSHKVVIDSWNNIGKYDSVTNSFFIFDEQRVIGRGAWVKAFLKIAKSNEWILLSATPGDTWMDYIPVFIANGFYKNRTEFQREHVIFNPRVQFPKVDRYVNIGTLIRHKESILIDMDYRNQTILHHMDIPVRYAVDTYKFVGKKRWNPFTNEPIINATELCYTWRKVVNSDISRQEAVLNLADEHSKVIIFYNFDYELEILKELPYRKGTAIAEWNGHKHELIPKSSKWVYLVQYTAGCEGWNCIETDTIIFYSQNYSYKVMVQAAGRTDRRNTPFKDLYYYHLKSSAPIDLAIGRALNSKRNFNESNYVKW